jgi:hypothetical protein
MKDKAKRQRKAMREAIAKGIAEGRIVAAIDAKTGQIMLAKSKPIDGANRAIPAMPPEPTEIVHPFVTE